MKLFSTWSRDQVIAAIQSLETNLANGQQSVSINAQGSVAYTSPDNARSILRDLYRRLDVLDGTRSNDGPRVILQRISGGTF